MRSRSLGLSPSALPGISPSRGEIEYGKVSSNTSFAA